MIRKMLSRKKDLASPTAMHHQGYEKKPGLFILISHVGNPRPFNEVAIQAKS